MIPIPQYPLYTATISLQGGVAIPYYLNESQDWGTSIKDLKAALDKSKTEGPIDARALCVINPGNPTGQCLTLENMEQVFIVILIK